MAKQRDTTHVYKTGCLVCGHEVFTTEEAEYHGWAYDAAGRSLLACPDCELRFGHNRLLHAGEQCVMKKDPVGQLVQHACGEVLLARDWLCFFWRRDGQGPVFHFCPKCDKYISFLEKPLFEETAIKPYHEGKPKQEDKASAVDLDPDIWSEFVDGLTITGAAPEQTKKPAVSRGEGFLSALLSALHDDGPQDPQVRAAYAKRQPASIQDEDDGEPKLDPDVWGSLFDPNGATVPEPAPAKRRGRPRKS
jgi:hypothetical protein